MSYDTKQFQLRQQILVFLAQIVQKSERGARLVEQVDGLVEELEKAWEAGDLKQLSVVHQKAKALTELAQKL
jgi:hypothetical protein